VRVLPNDLRVGDAIRLNDWDLHVLVVEPGARTAVRTAEFDFCLYFGDMDTVNIVRTVRPAGPA
jgi:hypothetical protein